MLYDTQVNWKKLIVGMMQQVGMSLDDSEPIIAVAPAFLEKIGHIVSKYPARWVLMEILSVFIYKVKCYWKYC